MTRAIRLAAIEPVPAPKHCAGQVDGATTPSRVRARYELSKRGAGRAPDQCGRRAVYEVDGEPLCYMHAGGRALAILSGERT